MKIRKTSILLISLFITIMIVSFNILAICAVSETVSGTTSKTISDSVVESDAVNIAEAKPSIIPVEAISPEYMQYNAQNYRNSLIPGMRVSAYFLIPIAILILFTYYKLSKTINLSK